MRLLVTGGRDFLDVPWLWRTLDRAHAKRAITLVMEGASDDVTGPYVGADYWAHQWALARGIEAQRFKARWRAEGRAAGPNRNARMLEIGRPDAGVAFPGGNGTADMVRKLAAAGVPVWDLRGEGA